MADGGLVNRTLLQSYYQNPPEVYDDKKTEGALETLADQMDRNFQDYSGKLGSLTSGAPYFDRKYAQAAALYNKALDEMTNSVPLDSLTQAKAGVRRGTLNMVGVGDSTVEGIDKLNLQDTFFNRITNSIKSGLPGVTVTSNNFGLAGRQLWMLMSSTYVGLAAEPADLSAGFYRPWSTVGKSWLNTVRDSKPDLLILGTGMNDAFGNNADDNEAVNLGLLMNEVKTWSPVPSIVLIPTFLPTKDLGRYGQTQVATQRIARATREFAKANGIAIADANRLYQILLDGKEEVTRAAALESNWQGFNTDDWIGDKASFAKSGNTLSPVDGAFNKFVTRTKDFYNGVIEEDYTPTSDGFGGSTAWINYREDSAYGKFIVLVTAGNGTGSVGLFTSDSTTALIFASNLNIPSGQTSKIKVEVNGKNHKVYINDVLRLDFDTYKKMHDGKISIGSEQTLPTFSNLNITYFDPIQSAGAYTEDDLLGKPNDPTTSGNGINHLTGMGDAMVYQPAFNGIIRDMTKPVEHGLFLPNRLVTGMWGATTGDGGYPATTATGKQLYYQAMPTYKKGKGLALKKLNDNTYIPLSAVAVSRETLTSLEDGKYAYFQSPDAAGSDLLFVSSSAPITWEYDVYRFEKQQ